MRSWASKTLFIAGGFCAGVVCTALAQPQPQPSGRYENQVERPVALDEVLLDSIRIESRMNSWTLRKLCIDGQAYWLGFGQTTPSTFAPAFKQGRPETCTGKGR